MTKFLLIAWLVFNFPFSSMVIYLTNEKLELIDFAYTISTLYNIDQVTFIKLLNCESSLNPKAKGDYRIEEDRFMANGIAQFWKETFDGFSKKYNLSLDYESPHDQIVLAGMMVRDGFENHWKNCWKSATKPS